MIRLRGVSLSRGGRPLLDRVDASISAGERIALIGRNGSGKTSLLSALAGELPLDAGDIEQPWQRVIRLEQGLPSAPLPAWQFIVASDSRLAAATRALEEANAGDDGERLAAAHEQWVDAGGLDAPARCRALLAGLGFDDAQAEMPVDALSGGWRMRLNLARALFAPSELLLLDEPTNHLDLDAILWLERWLLRYPGTMLIVSHDRDFLDRVATASLHIDDGRLVRYAGGYSEFERLRAQRELAVQRQQAAVAARTAQLNSFIERFRAKATKARQVQSRIKALERLAQAAPLRTLRGVSFELHHVGDSPDPLLDAEALDAGYGERSVLRNVKLSVRRGARIGILGRNGAGKSTLIRTLVGELPPRSGEVRIARQLRIGYFAQQGIERLRDDESGLRQLQRIAPQAREQVLRDYLGRFGFSGDDATRPVGPMSGGEKARLLLALVLWPQPQLLVLDEPTNHLDAQTRDALADALADFDGALVLVSHDRYLLRATVDTLKLVDDGGVSDFDGDLDDYADWLARGAGKAAAGHAERSGGSAAPHSRAAHSRAAHSGAAHSTQAAPPTGVPHTAHTAPTAPPASRRDDRRLAAQRRAQLAERLRPLERELADLEARLAQVEAQLGQIEAELAQPLLYRNAARATALSRERAALSREREQIEERWLTCSTQRDAQREAFEQRSADR